MAPHDDAQEQPGPQRPPTFFLTNFQVALLEHEGLEHAWQLLWHWVCRAARACLSSLPFRRNPLIATAREGADDEAGRAAPCTASV